LIFIKQSKRGRQENSCGQARGQNQFRVHEVQSGRQARGQVGRYGVQKTGKGQKLGGLANDNRSRSTGKPLVDLKSIQDKLAQETRNTGIYTPGIRSDIWRGWRQSQDR
jgi:hypothetical protein